ncbi:MAG: DUF397 domain-containing protein [Dactylosporangium sp.]|nr:DUF397 domain-containing protein [Dactylosporangium sp.]NNJ62935.1 DUF397 domain-containing protein [Dactylosporangium sp.]
MGSGNKPTVDELQVDLASQAWQRSGAGVDALETAMVEARGARWVLVRIAGDVAGRVLVYSRHEWACFLDGAKGGEFDEALG